MQLSARSNSYLFRAGLVSLSCISPPFALAGQDFVDNTTITQVVVNGGADTANPGTTCLQISSAVSQACTVAFLAIPNNNKQLLAAALQAKAAGNRVWLYYENNAGLLHCPGLVFTPCSVISISVK